MKLFMLAVLFTGAIWSDTIGILANPAIAYPPTSSTGYSIGWLADAVYQIEPGETLNPVYIDGREYIEVEADTLPDREDIGGFPVSGLTANPAGGPDCDQTQPACKPAPVTDEIPEPATTIITFAGLFLLAAYIQRHIANSPETSVTSK